MKKIQRRLALQLHTIRPLGGALLSRVAGGLMTDPDTDPKTELCDTTPDSYLCQATVACTTGGVNTMYTK